MSLFLTPIVSFLTATQEHGGEIRHAEFLVAVPSEGRVQVRRLAEIRNIQASDGGPGEAASPSLLGFRV